MRIGPRRLAAVVATAVLFTASVAAALGRPPPLEPQDGCELWRGTVSGNDPSVLAELRICPAGGERLAGKLQWSSTTSGHNVRELEGTRHAGHLELHDTHFAEYRPAPGWRFCLVDRYALDQHGDSMTGHYVASACTDNARVTLSRVRPVGAH